MRHSMLDFILDLKNIQTINKWITQDYYTIIQKKRNNQTVLKKMLDFLLCLLEKILFLSKILTLRIEKKKKLADLLTVIFYAALPIDH